MSKHKKVYVPVGFTDSQRKNQRSKMENKLISSGWLIKEYFNGGQTKPSYFVVEKDPNAVSGGKLPSPLHGWQKLVLVLICIGIIGSIFGPKHDVRQTEVQKNEASIPLPVYIKEIVNSDDIQLTEQVDAKGTYLADIRIKKDPFMGGQSDWNMVAGETFNYCKKLLENPAIARLHFTYYSPENKNVDWAHIWIKRKDLPENWRDSYLYFFSVIQVDSSTAQSGQWLCDFYKKYETARPHGEMPQYCSRYQSHD